MVCTLNFHAMSRQGCVHIIMFWSVIVMGFVQKMALLYLINFVTSNLSLKSVTNLLVPVLLVIALRSCHDAATIGIFAFALRRK